MIARRILILLGTALLSFGLHADQLRAQERITDVIDALVPSIELWGTNPALVAAVKAQNSKDVSLARIQELDREWIASTGTDDFAQALMTNPAAAELFRLESSRAFFVELFLMDRRGAIVAMTNRTSDYWQGDEAKFIRSFKRGEGDVHISDVTFDESTNAFLVQISVPVKEKGHTIGALTVGANLNRLLVSGATNKSDSTSLLTDEEKLWLAEHPDIRWGFGSDFQPFLMKDKEGELFGIYVDLMEALNQTLGLRMTMEAAPWSDLVTLAREGKVAAVPGTSAAGAKGRQQVVSNPITYYSAAIYTRADAPFRIDSWDDLADLRVVDVEQRVFTKRFLLPFQERSEILLVSSINEAFRLLLENKADAFVGGVSDNYHITQGSMVGLKLAYLDANTEPFGIGIRSDWPLFTSIINKGLAAIGTEKINAIHARWINLPIQSAIVSLTKKERAWLNAHPNIRVGLGDIKPAVVTNENGKYSGIYVDFVEALNQRLSINMSMDVGSFADIVSKAKNGEVDAVMGTTATGAEKRNQLLSIPISRVGAAFFTRSNSSFTIDGWQDLTGLRIVHAQSHALTHQQLEPFQDTSKVITAESVKQAMTLVLENKADVYVGNVADNYYISKGGFIGLQLSYMDSMRESYGIAVRKDWPELVSILNKGLESIGSIRRNAIISKWLNLPNQKQTELLSPKQRAWVEAHPDIQFGFGLGFEPFLILDENGQLSGMMSDLIEELNRQLNMTMSISAAPWSTTVRRVEQRKIDGLLGASEGISSEYHLLRANPTHKGNPAAFSRTDASFSIDGWQDLAGKRIVHIKARNFSQNILEPYKETSEIILVSTVLDALNLLLANKADIFVGGVLDNYHISKNLLVGIQLAYIDPNSVNLGIAIRQEWPELVDIINKGIEAIGEDELNNMTARWLNLGNQTLLSSRELTWLKALPPLKIARLNNQAPFEYTASDGALAGITKDYVDILAERLGLDIEPTLVDQKKIPYPELLKGEVDLSFLLAKKSGYETVLSHSKPYLNIPLVVVTRRNTPLIQSLSELENKTIVVIDQSASYDVMTRNYPDLKLRLVSNYEKGLHAVIEGKAYALLGNSVSLDYLQRTLDINNLKISLSTNYSYRPVITVRKELEPLIPIFEKALANFTAHEKKLIFDKWVNPPLPAKIDWRNIAMWGALIFSIIAAFIILQQRKIRQSQEKAITAFESSLKLKNDFLTTISHELRTPMNAIIGGLQVAQAHPLEQLKSPLDVVQGGASDMMRLINDILSYSEIQADQCHLHSSSVSIRTLLDQLFNTYHTLCTDKGLALEWNVDKSLPERIEIDEEKFQTVAEKLIENAIKFTKEGYVRVDVQCEKNLENLSLVLKVKDSGIGIADSDKEDIFEAFRQKESGFHRRFGGVGIGLSICKKLASTMNGDITIESKEGRGSCFSVKIPTKLGKTPEQPITSDLASPNLPILVVEDNKFNQKIMQKMLEKMGYKSVLADHGEEALEVLKSETVSLILMDLQMHIMDGFVCTENIRQGKDDIKDIPIIAVTANLMDNDKKRCAALGMNGIIKKPVRIDSLQNTLSHYIESPH